MDNKISRPRVVIIGAGAAGLYCAAKLPQGLDITILEQLDVAAKKLLATGNGRCNISNTDADLHPELHYHGDCAFACRVLKGYSAKQTAEDFGAMGLDLTGAETQPLVYPASYQAKSVKRILEYNCKMRGVKIVKSCTVTGISKTGISPVFKIETNNGNFTAEYVVLAAGGKSVASLGSTGTGYCLARDMGHTLAPRFPALVQLKSSSRYPSKLKGIRVKGTVALEIDGKIAASKSGEILFADYGISGICTLELSRIVSEERLHNPQSHITAVIDLVPRWSEEELKARLGALVDGGFAPEETLMGILPEKLAHIIAEQAKGDAALMAQIAKCWRLIITETLGFDYSQVTCGGVITDDVNAETMESKLCPNLYILGEMLNVDGDCGGFNLQFAWSCGALCAMDITKKTMNTETKL